MDTNSSGGSAFNSGGSGYVVSTLPWSYQTFTCCLNMYKFNT